MQHPGKFKHWSPFVQDQTGPARTAHILWQFALCAFFSRKPPNRDSWICTTGLYTLCQSMPRCSLSSDHCLWYDHFLWSGRRVLSPSEKETEAWSQRQQRMDELYNQASLPSRRLDPDVHVPRRPDPDVHACLQGGVQLVDELEKGLI